LDAAALAGFVGRVATEAGVTPILDAPPGVEVVRRKGPGRSFLFVFNHTQQAADVMASGLDVRANQSVDGSLTVPAGGYAVILEK
jgi:beta-galactosidase